MIVKKYTVELYDYDIIFCFNDNGNKSKKNISKLLSKYNVKKEFINQWTADARGWTFWGNDESIIVINLNTLSNQNDLITTLRHEVHHASANLYEMIGNVLYELDEESFLYLNDWIFERGLEVIENNSIFIKDKKNKKKWQIKKFQTSLKNNK